MIEEIQKRIKNLPPKQQIGLYVILAKLYSRKNESFLSSNFSEAMQKYFKIDDSAQYGKTIGGILSSLSRNNLIERVSGGRNPLWTIPEDIKKNSSLYKNAIFNVTTYWQK